ncbi:hypothetical protein J6590_044693 [Homalodisca vitripennis]|nr:hypothetical protein J6590_044693 [Homalodisca vitripennis]
MFIHGILLSVIEDYHLASIFSSVISKMKGDTDLHVLVGERKTGQRSNPKIYSQYPSTSVTNISRYLTPDNEEVKMSDMSLE